MRTKKLLSLITGIIVAFWIAGCENNDEIIMPEGSILPGQFKVDIPSAISRQGNPGARTAVDTLDGNAVYEHLTTFIHIGEEAAEIVEDIITSIGIYNINKPMVLSFEGEDDGRIKNLEVIENVFFEGDSWEYQLTITDAESEGNEDGGKAIQVFWNRDPVSGVAILKPYNIDRDNDEAWTQAMFRIAYSETGDQGYDRHMIVEIAGLPLAEPLDDPYSMKALKMFVGKTGDMVDVYGNSDHPNAIFFSGQAGFNWAFAAAGDDNENLGVAEVGLPPSQLDATGRSILLEDYSIKNVFTDEIYAVWPFIDEQIVNAYLHNTEAPGYFNNGGFVQGGISPGAEYDALEGRVTSLSPYNPREIANLSISFK